MTKRIRNGLIAAGALVLAAGVAAAVWLCLPAGRYQTVARISGLDICRQELEDQMRRDRATIINEFQSAYGADTGNEKFWQTEYDGRTPMDALRDTAMQHVRLYKMQQQLAIDYGILQDASGASYEAFEQALELENQNRAEQIQAGEAVYGAAEFTTDTYYDYRLSNLQIALREKLSASGQPLDADEATLRSFYEQKKQTDYKKVQNARLRLYTISFDDSGLTEQQAGEQAGRLHALLLAGADNPAQGIGSLTVTELTLNEDTAAGASKTDPIVYTQALQLQTGEYSEIFQNRAAFCILYCETAEAGGYQSYDEVADAVRSLYIREQYPAYIEKLNSSADFSTLPVYERVSV